MKFEDRRATNSHPYSRLMGRTAVRAQREPPECAPSQDMDGIAVVESSVARNKHLTFSVLHLLRGERSMTAYVDMVGGESCHHQMLLFDAWIAGKSPFLPFITLTIGQRSTSASVTRKEFEYVFVTGVHLYPVWLVYDKCTCICQSTTHDVYCFSIRQCRTRAVHVPYTLF